MRMLYPDGIPPEQMTDALAIVRIIDKLFRIATKKDAFGESPFRDIAGYGLLGAHRHDLERLMAEGQERTANHIEDAIKARQGVYADALSSHDERNDDDVLPESSHDAGWGER